MSLAAGTPTAGDGATSAEDKARAMISALDRQQALADGVAVTAGIGLRAGVACYGAAAEAAGTAQVKARLSLHYAGLDERIDTMAPAWQAALTAAGVRCGAHAYPGVNHAFNNDTATARYDKAAADLAWQRTLALLKSAS